MAKHVKGVGGIAGKMKKIILNSRYYSVLGLGLTDFKLMK